MEIENIWNDELFVLFIKKRFPEEKDESYITEWKDRFKTGNPLRFMDDDSIRTYTEAAVELYGDKEMFNDIIKEIIIGGLSN